MRVLHVVEATTAGVGRHVQDLCQTMMEVGLEVGVACPRLRQGAEQDVAFVERVRQTGAEVHIVPMRRSISPVSDIRSYWTLGRLLARDGPDVVHAHSSKAGALGRLAARRAGCRAVVYTPNAFAFLGIRVGWRRWVLEGVERWLGHHATDALLCVSRSELALAQSCRIAPPERLMLIENGIEPERVITTVESAEAKTLLGLEPHRPVIGYAGRLAQQKGLETLINAAVQVRDSAGEAQFLLVGEGEMERSLRAMVSRRGLDTCFRFSGYLSDIRVALAAMDVFVLPSLYEGLPYSLMEAMAAGRAVVAARVGGNSDLIQDGETGFLVPPEDSATLANVLLRLLSAPEERTLVGEKAAEVVRTRTTPKQMTMKVVALYQSLMEGG